MLTAETVARMTEEELRAAQKSSMERFRLNGECQRFAAGVSTKRTRSGSRIRAWRVAKPDRQRLQKLEAEGREILQDMTLLSEEQRRRAHAEEARA